MGATAATKETGWTRLAAVEAEIQTHDATRARLQNELDELSDALETSRVAADAADPKRWSPERAKYFEALHAREAKSDELLAHDEKRPALVARREAAKRDIQAVEQQIGKAEREYSSALDEHERAALALRIARERKQPSRVLDAEANLKSKADTLAEKTATLEAAWALRPDCPRSVGECKNSADHITQKHPILRLKAEHPEYREAEDAVSKLENEFNRLNAEISPLEATFKKEQQSPFPITSGMTVTPALREAYPEIGNLESRGASASALNTQRLMQMSKKLTGLCDRRAQVEADLKIACEKRDALFEQLSKSRAAR